MRKFLINFLLVAVSIGLGLVAIEIGIRVFGLATGPSSQRGAANEHLRKIVEFDPELETRYRPSAQTTVTSPYGEFEITYAFNELGLRDRTVSKNKREGEFRILALGNSFVEGWGVDMENDFLNVAERLLNARLKDGLTGKLKNVRLVNGGIAGYGGAQSYLLFRRLLPAVAPDGVVFFYIGTMVSDDYKFLKKANLDDSGLATGLNADAYLNQDSSQHRNSSSKFEASPFLTALLKHSHAVRLLVLRWKNYQLVQRIVEGDPATDYMAGLRDRGVGILENLLRPSLRHVAAIRGLARENRIRFLFVHLPMPFQLASTEWTEGRGLNKIADGILPADDRRVVTQFCKAEEFNCIGAHDYLRRQIAADPSRHLYYTYDFHFTTAGHRVFAEWLANVIYDNFLLGYAQKTNR